MRFVSIILLVCIVLLSTIGDMATPSAAVAAMDCCQKEKTSCHTSSHSKNKSDQGCEVPGCKMLFSCQLCGFIVKDFITLKPVQAYLLNKPVTPYIIPAITSYKADNWKPPKNC